MTGFAHETGPEELVARLRPWLRGVDAFDSALAWGWPRCRTLEERLLYPCLLVALAPYAAVVAPRRLPEGAVASFQIGFGRESSSGPIRKHLIVLGVDEAAGDDATIAVQPELIRSSPWDAATSIAARAAAMLVRDGG